MKQRASRLPLLMREEACKQVVQMSKDGLIKQSTSPWASQGMLVKKKDGNVWFSIDYCKLNAVTTTRPGDWLLASGIGRRGKAEVSICVKRGTVPVQGHAV